MDRPVTQLVMVLPRLSICIPTYNRYLFVEELIRTIVGQIEAQHLESVVEVVVSDNGSTDGSVEAFAQFDTVSFVKIVRLPENKGADFNFYNVALHASGTYIWWCCSDDMPESDGIITLLSAIESQQAAYYLSHYVYDFNLDNRMWKNPDPKHLGHPLVGSDGFVEMGYTFGYVGALVINRAAWNSIENPLRFKGTQYVHVAWMAELMCTQNGAIEIIEHPIVKHRYGNDSFLDGNRFKRTMIDVLGYQSIGSFWLPRSKFRRFYRIVFEQHVTWGLEAASRQSMLFWLKSLWVAWRYAWAPGISIKPRWIFRMIVGGPAVMGLRWIRRISQRGQRQSSPSV